MGIFFGFVLSLPKSKCTCGTYLFFLWAFHDNNNCKHTFCSNIPHWIYIAWRILAAKREPSHNNHLCCYIDDTAFINLQYSRLCSLCMRCAVNAGNAGNASKRSRAHSFCARRKRGRNVRRRGDHRWPLNTNNNLKWAQRGRPVPHHGGCGKRWYPYEFRRE